MGTRVRGGRTAVSASTWGWLGASHPPPTSALPSQHVGGALGCSVTPPTFTVGDRLTSPSPTLRLLSVSRWWYWMGEMFLS